MKYLLSIAALFITSLCYGQGIWSKSATNTIVNRGKDDSVRIIPRDTLPTNNALYNGVPVGDHARIAAKDTLMYFHNGQRNKRLAFFEDLTSGPAHNLQAVTDAGNTTTNSINIINGAVQNTFSASASAGVIGTTTNHSLGLYTFGLENLRMHRSGAAGSVLVPSRAGTFLPDNGVTEFQVNGTGFFNGTVTGSPALNPSDFIVRSQLTDSLTARLNAYNPGIPTLQQVTTTGNTTTQGIALNNDVGIVGNPGPRAELYFSPSTNTTSLTSIDRSTGATPLPMQIFSSSTFHQGRLGIGIANPLTTLHVAKDTDYGTNTWSDAQIIATGATNQAKKLAMGYSVVNDFGFIQAGEEGVAYRNFLLNPAAGNVGVGLTDPLAKFEVRGNAFIGDAPIANSGRLRITPQFQGVLIAGELHNGTNWLSGNLFLTANNLSLSGMVGVNGDLTISSGGIISSQNISVGLNPTIQSAGFAAGNFTTYRVDNSLNTITITLPTASTVNGRLYMFQIISGSGGNAVTIDGTSVILGSGVRGPLAMVQSDGTNWIFLQGF